MFHRVVLRRQDIDEILQRAAKKTAELNSKFEGMKKEGLSSASWSFGADEEVDEQQKLLDTGSAFIDIGKRSRKTTRCLFDAIYLCYDAFCNGTLSPRRLRCI
eukprot:SAG11_NODE_601_length_8254_cov_12.333047_6_plen_103_part_00